jgi:hypothetical protein
MKIWYDMEQIQWHPADDKYRNNINHHFVSPAFPLYFSLFAFRICAIPYNMRLWTSVQCQWNFHVTVYNYTAWYQILKYDVCKSKELSRLPFRPFFYTQHSIIHNYCFTEISQRPWNGAGQKPNKNYDNETCTSSHFWFKRVNNGKISEHGYACTWKSWHVYLYTHHHRQ